MGFWDSILQGAEDAASWLSQNSDSILNVAGALAKAAGAAELDATSFDQDDNAFPGMMTNLNKAASRMQELAKSMAPAPVPVGSDTLEGPFNLTGVGLNQLW